MERILIRAGVAPWAEYNALDVITDKIIGNNTGNLLFANSITRLVATADSRVDFISDLTLVKKQITAQEINENYDRLPLFGTERPGSTPAREAAFDPGIQAVLYRLCVQSAGFQKVRRALHRTVPQHLLCASVY